MKKFALSMMTMGAMFFATQNMQAQEEEVEEIETEVEMEVEHDEFASVEVTELPQAVHDALATDYNGAIPTGAWVKMKGETKVYKLKLDIQGETEKVYIDQDGNWLEKDDDKESDK